MRTEIDWEGNKNDAWIETYTGIKFNVFDPKSELVNILDIAHALSMCVRFNGHLPYFYSVAEHSWHMSNLVEDKYALAALLHDASEAYFSDIPRPIKYMFPQVREVDDKVSDCILSKYGVTGIDSSIHTLDRSMCLTEAKHCGMNTEDWPEGHEQYGVAKVKLRFWSWKTARTMYLNRFDYLTGGRWKDEY